MSLQSQTLRANDWPSEVLDFCRKHGLESDLKLAVQLAEKHFRNARHTVEMNGDPENDSEWIVVRFDARGTVASVLDDYSCCKKEWVQLSSQSGRFLIRFSYNIV